MVIPWEVIRRDKMKFYYYKISNIKNGSFYIGITTDYIKKRKNIKKNMIIYYNINLMEKILNLLIVLAVYTMQQK